MKKSSASEAQSASQLISQRIAELGDWRGKTLGRMRKLIKEADPEVVEKWKWMGTPLKDPARLIAPDGLSRYHRVGSVEVASPRFSRI